MKFLNISGSELASPINSKMLQAMKDLWTQSKGSHLVLWTGVHATFSKGDYYSVRGVLAYYLEQIILETIKYL